MDAIRETFQFAVHPMHGDAGPTLWVRCSHLDQSHASIWSLIDAHPFNEQLQLILPQPVPGKLEVPSLLGLMLTLHSCAGVQARLQALTGFYYSVTCTPGAFCQADFIERHLKEPGSRLQALSVNSNVARGDAVALTPDGWLHLAVSKDTYQYLGLTGRSLSKGKLHLARWKPTSAGTCFPRQDNLTAADRYCISIKLTGHSFRPGNHTHDKVKTGKQETRFKTLPSANTSNRLLSLHEHWLQSPIARPASLLGVCCRCWTAWSTAHDHSHFTAAAPRTAAAQRWSLPASCQPQPGSAESSTCRWPQLRVPPHQVLSAC